MKDKAEEFKDKLFTIKIEVYPNGIKKAVYSEDNKPIAMMNILGAIEYFKHSVIETQSSTNLLAILDKKIKVFEDKYLKD